MSFLDNLWGGARNATDKAMRQPQIAALKNQVEDFVQHVGDELGVLDELRYEWRRLQSFNNWPHDSPRPSELAKAGFFFSPIPQEPDRCAHFCNDKFFSSWDSDDDPLTVLQANCPDCPFLTGQSGNVPLPSAYERTGGGRSGGEEESDGQEKAEKPQMLGNYLSGAVQKAAGPDATVGASSLKGFAGEPQASALSEGGGGYEVPATGAANSGGLQVRSKSLRGKGKKVGSKKGVGGGLTGGSDDGAGPRVWEFPTAVGAGGGSEHGSEHGGFTPRAGNMCKEDFVALQAAVGTAVAGMQAQWEKQLGTLDGRLGGFKDRVAQLSSRAAALSDPKWLDSKKEALKGLLAEEASEKEALAKVRKQLEAAKKELEVCRQQLDKVEKAEELIEETDRRVREATEELQDLEDSKMQLEGDISELSDEKQHLLDEAEAERGRIRESMADTKAEKKQAEVDLVEVQETIERRKGELHALEERLGQAASREGQGLSRETELEAREKALKAKEEDVAQREEYVLQREGQKRAAR